MSQDRSVVSSRLGCHRIMSDSFLEARMPHDRVVVSSRLGSHAIVSRGVLVARLSRGDFSVFWGLVRRMLSSEQEKMVMFVRGEEIFSRIDRHQLPVQMGGTVSLLAARFQPMICI